MLGTKRLAVLVGYSRVLDKIIVRVATVPIIGWLADGQGIMVGCATVERRHIREWDLPASCTQGRAQGDCALKVNC
jgi:hypothetical protein